jgi:prepilin-type N-terminal cleavage/methylation domain-containing protein
MMNTPFRSLPRLRKRLTNGKRKGFTLVELIVTLAISAIVVGITATFLVSGGNFLANTEVKAEDKSLAEESADFVKNRLLYASSITVVRSAKPPLDTSVGEILYIGNDDGSEITNSGQLYYMRADDSSAVNAFGTGKYRSNALAMSYRAIVKTDAATETTTKAFEITMSTIRDGKATYNYTKTFTLYEAAEDAEPRKDMSIASWSNTGNDDDSMAKYYIMLNPTDTGYVVNGLVARFDAADNDVDSEGHPVHNPSLTTKWKDISGKGKDMTLNFTNTGSSNPTPIRAQSIYFDGAEDFGTIPGLSLTHGAFVEGMDYGVTVEVCFRQEDSNAAGALFEYGENWNQNSGFGIWLNSSNATVVPGMVHTNMGSPNARPVDYAWPNKNTTFTTHSNYFQMVPGEPARIVWIDGAKTSNLINAVNGEVEDYPFNYTGARQDFAVQPFFVASRNGAGEFYKGEIASIRIYNRMLTDKEVLQNSIEDRARFGF